MAEHLPFDTYLFTKLARISHARGQFSPRDKFLLLAAESLSRAGSSNLADRAFRLVKLRQPHHLLAGFPDWASAVSSDSGVRFLSQLVKFCSAERAELLLAPWDPHLEEIRPLPPDLLARLIGNVLAEMEPPTPIES